MPYEHKHAVFLTAYHRAALNSDVYFCNPLSFHKSTQQPKHNNIPDWQCVCGLPTFYWFTNSMNGKNSLSTHKWNCPWDYDIVTTHNTIRSSRIWERFSLKNYGDIIIMLVKEAIELSLLWTWIQSGHCYTHCSLTNHRMNGCDTHITPYNIKSVWFLTLYTLKNLIQKSFWTIIYMLGQKHLHF